MREFDVGTRRCLAEGFTVLPAKTQLDWIEADTICVASDCGSGSLTAAAYPRITKRWRRGQALADAGWVFAAEPSDVCAGV